MVRWWISEVMRLWVINQVLEGLKIKTNPHIVKLEFHINRYTRSTKSHSMWFKSIMLWMLHQIREKKNKVIRRLHLMFLSKNYASKRSKASKNIIHNSRCNKNVQVEVKIRSHNNSKRKRCLMQLWKDKLATVLRF